MNSQRNIAGLNSLKQAAENRHTPDNEGKSAISAGASQVDSALASAVNALQVDAVAFAPQMHESCITRDTLSWPEGPERG
jgi:hypothetical protein